MASDRHADAEARIRSAIAQLLAGDIPDGLKCDVKSLRVLAGVPRATLYRTYPHLKADFDSQRSAARGNGQQSDARLASIDRLKAEITNLRARLAARDREITELKRFRDTATSRLAAQHDEITALRTQPQTPGRATLRSLPRVGWSSRSGLWTRFTIARLQGAGHREVEPGPPAAIHHLEES